LLVGIINFGCYIPIYKPTPQQKAHDIYSIAKQLKQYITVYEIIKGDLPWTTNAVGMEQDIIELSHIQHSIDKDSGPGDEVYILQSDPWGNPYHIWFNTNSAGPMRIGGYSVTNRLEVWADDLTITNRIAIWSDGRNGENEYGGGDDINTWETEEENMARLFPGDGE